jgi:hypothetical protein
MQLLTKLKSMYGMKGDPRPQTTLEGFREDLRVQVKSWDYPIAKCKEYGDAVGVRMHWGFQLVDEEILRAIDAELSDPATQFDELFGSKSYDGAAEFDRMFARSDESAEFDRLFVDPDAAQFDAMFS